MYSVISAKINECFRTQGPEKIETGAIPLHAEAENDRI
jgi:hypothetical protein